MSVKKTGNKIQSIKNYLVLWLTTIAILFVAFIPTWIYLLARFIFNPDNALVEIMLFGVSLYFLGALQIFAIIIAVIIVFTLWESS